MEISKNKTTLTKKLLSQFQTYEILKKSWLIIISSILLIILGFGVYEGRIVLRSIPFIVIGVLIFPFYFFLLKLLFKKQNKTFKEVTLVSTFFDDRIEVNNTDATQLQKNTVFYKDLHKIRITKKNIFLYVDSTSSIVLDKNGFFQNTFENTLNLLKLKVPEKFKIKIKK